MEAVGRLQVSWIGCTGNSNATPPASASRSLADCSEASARARLRHDLAGLPGRGLQQFLGIVNYQPQILDKLLSGYPCHWSAPAR